MLEKLRQVHEELLRLNIGVWAGFFYKKGLVVGAVSTSSWRSYTTQLNLYNQRKTRTLRSNHRRGTAIDVYPKSSYVTKIKETMAKYNLVNDLAGDAVHFNLHNNREASKYLFIGNDNGITKLVNVDQQMLYRFEGKYVQRVEARGEIYKVKNGYLTFHKGCKSPLFDEWSKFLNDKDFLTGLNEENWNKIKDSLI